MTISQITHILAVAAGVLGIVAGSSAVIGLPSYVTGIIGVAIAVLVYISNSLPALNAPTDASKSDVPAQTQ